MDNNKDKLYDAIMNIQCDVEQCSLTGASAEMSYKQGHRDARHAAADLVNEFAAQAEQTQPAGAARQGGITSEKSDSQELIESFLEASSASLASQSQAAQPTKLTDEQIIELAVAGHMSSDDYDNDQSTYCLNFARAIEREVLTGTSQATKAQAEPDLHNAIMNLPCKRADNEFMSAEHRMLYKNGHRDARHAATELALAAPVAKEAPTAWLATDLDGRGDVGFTKEEAKSRAGEGCTEFFPLYDLSPVASVAKEATKEAESVQAEKERDDWMEEAARRSHTIAILREKLDLRRLHDKNDVWFWQGDGTDHPESMSNSMAVVIRADQLKAIIAPTTSTVSAPNVQVPEDVALMALDALSLATMICDAVPNQADKLPEGDPLQNLGRLVNYQESTGHHGYALIRDAQALFGRALGRNINVMSGAAPSSTEGAQKAPEEVRNHALTEILSVGGQMANVMYNLAQAEGRPLERRTCETMDSLRKQWDALKRTTSTDTGGTA